MTEVAPAPKKRIGRTIAIVVGLLIIALVAVIATRPDTFRIERSGIIHTPAGIPFSLINDFHEWSRWSPFEKLDPNLKRTFEGAESGPGAVYGWSGNAQAGEGRMTILESKPGELVVIKLQFTKPFAATCQTTFKLAPADGDTRVSWIMEGTNNFVAKAFSLLMNMDSMLGKDFEEGLAKLDVVSQEYVTKEVSVKPAGAAADDKPGAEKPADAAESKTEKADQPESEE